MRVVVQRVSRAEVVVAEKCCGRIGQGLLVFAAVENSDTLDDVEWIATKLVRLRCFEDECGKMNLSLLETGGNILLISQFTLFGNLRKGTRPSFNRSAGPDRAIPLYEALKSGLSTMLGKEIACGVFAADMQITAVNEGPVTLILDSRNKDF